ncbi:MAG TPA: alpha-amylase family glycosyl hydrolase [Candidatus Limnocylindrales bacterium]|nr:alpha-amylase family glycosyl hydrolase [Candidatus Limnocylindrales bacterium]
MFDSTLRSGIPARRRLLVAAALAIFLASLFPAAVARPVLASHTPAPTSVTIAGSLQSELGCAGDWDPGCASTHLAYDAADDAWQAVFNVPAGGWEYKAALNGGWDENYGANAQPGGANIALNLGGTTSVKFYYDHKSHWVTSSQNAVIAVAPGNFQSELGCPGDWSPDCLRSWLQDPDGDGTYSFVTTAIPAGSWEGKVALNEGWDVNYGAGGVPGGPNIGFTVPAAGSTTTFSYDATTHVLTISSVAPTGPGHDNNVLWDGLRHDSRDTLYRAPGGAVAAGTPVILRFRTFHGDVTSVGVRLFSYRTGGAQVIPMQLAAADVDCRQDGLPAFSCDLWQATVPAPLAAQPDNLWYRFVVTDGTDTDYYGDDTAALDGGLGTTTDDAVDLSWALMQFVPGFTSPDWASEAVIYQIFPDRFRNGRRDNDAKTGDIRYDDPVLRLAWGTLPEGYCRNYAVPDAECPARFRDGGGREQPAGRDYMGGDLKGVDQKLDYLASLGVTAIYFNPIFDAGSNHAYDTQDYYRVDPYFGTQKDFDNLVKHATSRGIRIILDGVYNHMSSDSPLFDRYGHYDTLGACESPDSPYRDWFVFTDTVAGGGPCVGSDGTPGGARYESWFGFDSIPVLRKSQAEVQEYFLTADDSVAKHWLEAGASGWRMDVSGDASFPNGYWESFRQVVKAVDPEVLTISETWQKDSTLLRMIRGDRLDTTMNYRLRDAVLGFLAPQDFDAKGFADSGHEIEASEFLARLASVREDYPDAAYYALMNLLDSHDTERLLWTLTPGLETPAEKELNAANLAAGKTRVRLASLIQFTLPGAPTVYYGDEVAMTGDDDPDDRRTYPWSDLGGSPDMAMFAHYQSLAALRAAVPALTEGDFRALLADDAAGVAAYGRQAGSSAAIVVLNRSGSAQDVHVPVAGHLRDGVAFTIRYPSGGGGATSAGGEVVVTVPALGGVVLVANAGQDLTGPAAPTNLVATAGNAVVDLGWTGVAGAAGYEIYRSPVTAGGYERVGSSAGTAFADTTVENGRRYYYVVRARDAAGNVGATSNEAAATPSFPVGYAVLQWPKTTSVVRGQVTETIYGQVYVAGLTDAGAPAFSILAQLGFGAQGSNPGAWTTWKPMSINAGCCGNNFEYMGTLRPAVAGVFDLLVRFSTDGGLTWAYGDQDGFYPGESGTDMPGVLTVNESTDTTAPAPPTGLHVTDWAAAFIALAWTAPPDADVAEYAIYRSEDGGAFSLLETIAATATTYLDEAVASGTTYAYRVTALDPSLNESGPSNEVSQVAEPKLVDVTFRVRVPASTPDGATIYIPGNIDLLGPWNPGKQAMTEVGGGIWEVTLQILDGTSLEYKYTRGTWEMVEWWGSIVGTANRHATISYGLTGEQLVDDTATDWGSGPDEDKAVQAWRDPLVVSAAGSAAGVVVTFERNIQPESADYASSIVVTLGGTAVGGTTAETSDGVLTWTPAAALAAGTYEVTVFHVRSELGGDSVLMNLPYAFSFSVP